MVDKIASGSPDLRRLVTPARIVFVLCLAYFLGAVSIGWNNTILDFHGFRQTQTALSTYFMIGKWPKLAYETPVLGPPWPIPFEFPLYQWIVALIVTVLHTPLDQTGRFVSFVFFLLSLIPAYRLLSVAGISGNDRLLIFCLLLVSPFYTFWSRTFMIESTAFFFGMCYLAALLSYLETARWTSALCAALCGATSGMVKVTSFAIFLLAALIILAFRSRRAQPVFSKENVLRQAAVLGFFLCVPVACTFLWTLFADSQKERNPLGRNLTSTALREWNFGTLEQRKQPENWSTILDRAPLAVDPYVLFGSLIALGWLSLRAWLRRTWRLKDASQPLQSRWVMVASCGALYLSGPLIFFHAYIPHEYYAYSIDFFLICVAGICLITVKEKDRMYGRLAWACLPLIIGVSILRYAGYYYPIQSHNVIVLPVCRAIQKETLPDDILLGVGCDWRPEIPYYSRRRAIMMPDWLGDSLTAVPDYVPKDHSARIRALVVLNPRQNRRWSRETIQQVMRKSGYEATFLGSDPLFELYRLRITETRSHGPDG
jgi:hypothetical protein